MAPVLQNIVKICSEADEDMFGNVTCIEDLFRNITSENDNFQYLDIIKDQINMTNATTTSMNDEELKKLTEFHIIKAIVLSAVTIVILLSICKMVFGMILKYPGSKPN